MARRGLLPLIISETVLGHFPRILDVLKLQIEPFTSTIFISEVVLAVSLSSKT